MDDITKKLSQPFDPAAVKTREGPGGKMLSYIGVGDYANRLLSTIEKIDDMHVEIENVQVVGPFHVAVRGKGQDGKWITVHAPQHSVMITVGVTVKGSKRMGIGADDILRHNISRYTGQLETQTDVDKACKTALAEGFKKACFYFGIATYLWKDEKTAEEDPVEHVDQPPAAATPAQAAANFAVSEALMGKINDTRAKLGFSKTEMPGILKNFMKETLKIECDGHPSNLAGDSDQQTSSRVDQFISYMERLSTTGK